MGLELPSELVDNKTNEEVAEEVNRVLIILKTKERSLRALKSSAKSKREGLSEEYTSQYITLITGYFY